jgi:hypothetical protein
MARALLGHVGTVNEQSLLLEVTRLRRRIAELEAEMTELRTAAAGLDHSEMEIELHRLAVAAEPALA